MGRQGFGWHGVGLLLLTALAGWALSATRAAQDDDEPAKLTPGLVARYQAGDASVLTTTPTVALFLRPGEAPHPGLPAEPLTARWEGQIRIQRPDEYRFGAFLRGKVKVTVKGQDLLSAAAEAKDAAWEQGPAVKLTPGTYPLVVEFTRAPGLARLQLFWEAKHFVREPVPHDFVGHLPAQEPKDLGTAALADKGRLIAEEHACTACHRPAADDAFGQGLKNRPGPDLTKAGERLKPAWVAHWLKAPTAERPQAAMPHLFDGNPDADAEIYAITQYLATLGGPYKDREPRMNPKDRQNAAKRGEHKFTAVGCVVCHDGKAPLPNLGAKTSAEHLARYLQNPLAIDPSGRMPNLLLNGQEATDLALFLCKDEQPLATMPKPATEAALAAYKQLGAETRDVVIFRQLPEEQQWRTLGKQLVAARRCVNCHTIQEGGKPLAPVAAKTGWDGIKQGWSADKGCLAKEPVAGAPRFALETGDRQALRTFLAAAPTRNTLSPAYHARLTVQRFNCLGCHQQNGQGGLTSALSDQLRKVENAENAEAISPPPLTGVGAKLYPHALRGALVQANRTRPWMGLRMPQFGDQNVGHVPDALTALDGQDPEAKDPAPAYATKLVEAGRHLVGKKALGCITCHDLAGNPSSGTRGPDLAKMQERVRYGWYRRWLAQPQRMQPGTRMPTIFAEGRTLLDDVLGGKAEAQEEAMWVYLGLGMNLPLPEGLEPPKGMALTVKDRPFLLRTFMPEAGSKAIAVGFPGQVAVAFDAAQCRLAYAWAGNFLDAAPVWDGRGGNPAKLLGPRFWEAPRGFPWAFSASAGVPDFDAQAKDPGYGAGVPEGQVYQGPVRLHFTGYTLDKDGSPAFRYRVTGPDGTTATVTERARPLRKPAAVGLLRKFEVVPPVGQTVWLLAGETGATPEAIDAQGQTVPLALKDGRLDVPAEARLLVLPQGNQAHVLELKEAPAAGWTLARQGNRWLALVRISPPPGSGAVVPVALQVWSPYRAEPAVIRELLKDN